MSGDKTIIYTTHSIREAERVHDRIVIMHHGHVALDGTLDKLLEAGWVKPKGRRKTPGRPATWVTTPEFLNHFGLADVHDLPGVDELRAVGLIETDLDSKGMAKLEVFGARGISVVLQSTSTGLAKDGFFEAHREFVDVHVPLIGVESIGYTPLDGRVKKGGPVPIYNPGPYTHLTLPTKA